MTERHIATAAVYGTTGRRVGTRYLYSNDEIDRYVADLRRQGKAPQIRRARKESDA